MGGILEALAYAIARGVARAWFDVIRERSTAVEEVPADVDRARADQLRGAVHRMLATNAGAPRPVDPAPDRPAD